MYNHLCINVTSIDIRFPLLLSTLIRRFPTVTFIFFFCEVLFNIRLQTNIYRGYIDSKVIVHVPNTVAKQAMNIKNNHYDI